MNANKVHKKIEEFAAKRKYISFQEMTNMVLTWYEPFRIYSKKVSGRNITRDMYSVAGPSGDAVYDYEAYGYMVFYDTGVNDFRTIVMENVEKVVKDGITYYVS
jgi:hypothetical protein